MPTQLAMTDRGKACPTLGTRRLMPYGCCAISSCPGHPGTAQGHEQGRRCSEPFTACASASCISKRAAHLTPHFLTHRLAGVALGIIGEAVSTAELVALRNVFVAVPAVADLAGVARVPIGVVGEAGLAAVLLACSARKAEA